MELPSHLREVERLSRTGSPANGKFPLLVCKLGFETSAGTNEKLMDCGEGLVVAQDKHDLPSPFEYFVYPCTHVPQCTLI